MSGSLLTPYEAACEPNKAKMAPSVVRRANIRAHDLAQSNSLDTLRLMAALAVLVGHASIITGINPIMFGSIPLHAFGVCVFFSISGFLVTQSWMSDSNLGRYITRRALRIFPGLLVVLLATALIIGPIATVNPTAGYFSNIATYKYILSNLLLITNWSLPGVFAHVPISGQANGSLWTLPVEFALYLFTPIFVFFNRRGNSSAAIILLIASLVVTIAQPAFPTIFNKSIHGVNVGLGLRFAPFFWAGCALRMLEFYSWPGKVRRACFIIAAFLLLVSVFWGGHFPILGLIALIPTVYCVLFIGLSDWLYSGRISRLGDLSYGVYLWAFPVQQLVVQKLGGGPVLNIAISLPAALVLAYASWHLIERPALRLKPQRRRFPSEEHLPVVSENALQSPAA